MSNKRQPWVKKKQEPALKKQLETFSFVEMKASNGCGLGLYARRAFAVGDRICIYGGTPITLQDYVAGYSTDLTRAWWRDYGVEVYDERGASCVLLPERPTYIGGHLINHSCNPNAFLGETVSAMKRIGLGEQITADYAWVSDNPKPCHCRAANCTGNIGLTRVVSPLGGHIVGRAQVLGYVKTAIENRNASMNTMILKLQSGGVLTSAESVLRLVREAVGAKWDSDPNVKWWLRTVRSK